jgi:hypothetical protein
LPEEYSRVATNPNVKIKADDLRQVMDERDEALRQLSDRWADIERLSNELIKAGKKIKDGDDLAFKLRRDVENLREAVTQLNKDLREAVEAPRLPAYEMYARFDDDYVNSVSFHTLTFRPPQLSISFTREYLMNIAGNDRLVEIAAEKMADDLTSKAKKGIIEWIKSLRQ